MGTGSEGMAHTPVPMTTTLAAQYVGKDEVAVGGDLCHFTIIKAYPLYFVYLINSMYFL